VAVCYDPKERALVVTPSPTDQRVKERQVELPESLAPVLPQALELAVGPQGKDVALLAAGGALIYVSASRVSTHDLGIDGAVMAFARATPRLVVGGRRGQRGMLRTFDGERPGPVLVVAEPPRAIAFSADDHSVILGLNSGKLRVLDASTGALSREIALGKSPVVAIGAADDGQIAAADADGAVYAVAPDMKQGAVVHRGGDAVRCLAWTQEGRGLVIGTEAGRVSVIDVETGAAIALFKTVGAANGCARSQREDRMLVTSHGGSAWQRLLDLSPLFMATRPTNPLDAKVASVERWRGLEPEPGEEP
jgi:WD40 repeat protein